MASMAPWRQLLLESIQANKHLRHSEYFQLATVKENGRPANRTVVFRGFLEGTEKLQFTTDARTQKIEEIKTQAFGEICWYFTDSREQFRIGGVLDVIGTTETNPVRLKIREQAWFQSSPNSRLQFVGPSPGIPCVENGPDDNTTPKLDPAEGPVENFCLVMLEPEEVLRLRPPLSAFKKSCTVARLENVKTMLPKPRCATYSTDAVAGRLSEFEEDEEIFLCKSRELIVDTERGKSLEDEG